MVKLTVPHIKASLPNHLRFYGLGTLGNDEDYNATSLRQDQKKKIRNKTKERNLYEGRLAYWLVYCRV